MIAFVFLEFIIWNPILLHIVGVRPWRYVPETFIDLKLKILEHIHSSFLLFYHKIFQTKN